ncbi:hypothetical protein DESUT3_21550 [Desulfuromonas versatilis]|uniref:Cytochrome b/b6 N-terminal region profile domain-containing protein n=1 Tax=Desulfuromonas versatilis TaxID=2802975 RepID=A0ABM8HS23_9BACT|nr:cytochrome b N-terminal domain-containing protein [Desulfuromonas versatilis]BCR05086.1 hypothetical protein DESUT3_21550 [Desulfuromonas versatilis]
MAQSRRNFLHHLHPVRINRRTLHPATTLGLGVAGLTCLAVLLLSGLTLFLYYVPEQAVAYERILHITTTLPYGRLLRNLHYVAANGLLILAALHLTRVFLTGSYKERSLNWIYGLVLLMLILVANFTGYLLPWDQISYWAIKVGASLAAYFPLVGPGISRFFLGGDQVGEETLLRSFALHASVLPLLLLVFTALHLWRIRKDGGLAAPPQDESQKLPAGPWLYRAETAVALLTLAALIALALVLDAPLHERADPLHPPNPAKAPWYFVGFQEMVSWSATFGGVVAPLVIGLFLLFAPWFDHSRSHPGLWFARDRWGPNLAFITLALSQIAFIAVGLWLRGKNWQLQLPF